MSNQSVDTAFAALREAHRAYLEALSGACKTIAEELRGLPDNENLARAGERVFVVKASKVSSALSLDPFTYDYQRQYQMLADQILALIANPGAKAPRENLARVLRPGPQGGRFSSGGPGGEVYVFNPEAIRRAEPLIHQVLATVDLMGAKEGKV